MLINYQIFFFMSELLYEAAGHFVACVWATDECLLSQQDTLVKDDNC